MTTCQRGTFGDDVACPEGSLWVPGGRECGFDFHKVVHAELTSQTSYTLVVSRLLKHPWQDCDR